LPFDSNAAGADFGKLRPEAVICAQVLSERGRSVRSIASELGVDESTVRYRLQRLRTKAADRRCGKPEACDSHASIIENWIEQQASPHRPESVRVLYDLLVCHHGFTGSYKSVLRYVRRRTAPPPIRPVRRVETRPGLQAQVDWVQSRPLIIEEIGDRPVRLQAFVMILSHSRMWAVVWSVRQDMLSWLDCHNRAFLWLSGVPSSVRIDNLKTGVAEGGGAWAELNQGYASYAKQLGFIVDPCRVRTPQDKGKVERRGHDVKHLLVHENERFATIADLQSTTNQRVLDQSNRLLCPVTGATIYAAWQTEQEALSPLPMTLPQPFDVQVHRRVGRDCLVAFEGRQYSVPYRHSGGTVEVRGCARTVEIYRRGERIAGFPRHTDCRLLVDQAHYDGPSNERIIAPAPLGRMARQVVLPRSWELPEVTAPSRGLEQYRRAVEALS
jgi:transposase